ncbi:MAG: protein-L-isoaspartate(D-aspartate) O-methyltransferase [archaeon]|nr:protein-L-isoaspartate(D-aspartate) O-methyltransferase [archaeon]
MNFEAERKKLVEYISGFAITSAQIKKAVSEVRRENFLPENLKQHAYDDNAAPIGYGQTISQPSTITVMLELLGVKKGMKVLEIGSGSGYVLALLSKLVGEKGKVYGIEYLKELAEASEKNLKEEKIEKVEIKQGDGSLGWENEEFDRILISCACPFIPKKLFDQLKEKGRIVAPVGDKGTQILEILMKDKGKPFKKSYEGGLFTFVPMQGKHGYSTNL